MIKIVDQPTLVTASLIFVHILIVF